MNDNMTTIVPKPPNQNWMESLDENEQRTLLYMTMKSLRGSWRKPHRRAKMVYWLATTLPEESFEAIKLDYVANTAESFYARAGDPDGYHDGRDFRRHYEPIADEVNRSEALIERLATHIPDDMSFNHD